MARSPAADERCVPCEDGRRLLIAAVAARLGWGLAARRLGSDPAALEPWAALAVSAAAPALIYRLALSARLPRAAALIAGALAVVSPALVEPAMRSLPEAAAAALSAAFLLAALGSRRSGRVSLLRLAGAALIAGALAVSLRASARPAPAEPRGKWSAPVAVVPAGEREARALSGAFAVLLAVGALFGAAEVARGPGGPFVLGWLACAAAVRLGTGRGPSLLGDPALAVAAGAGLRALGRVSAGK